ncbi:MAG TPA: hypothetical protein VNN07_11060, partial [Candidatus Tectomicrobia bacterium]|nr:hypothetical protein [Candidatus Tectomicrobia bacterium]
RGIAAFVMILGISLFGFLTANISAFLVSRDASHSDSTLENIAAKVEALERSIESLRHEFARDRGQAQTASEGDGAASRGGG